MKEIQQPLKNLSGSDKMIHEGIMRTINDGYLNTPSFVMNKIPDPAAGEDYPLKPMHMLNEPCGELPEPPVGQKWEYFGLEAPNASFFTRYIAGEYHYWQPVDVVPELTPDQESEIVKEQDERLKDEYDCEPQYRMLEEGEIIRDGDEYFYHGKGMWEGTAGYHGHGRKYSKAFWGSDIRRPLSQLSDSQKLTLAIEALENARGWTVADEVLKQIL